MIVSLKNCNPFELCNPGGRKVVSKRFLFELNYDFSVLRLWSPSRKAGYKQYNLENSRYSRKDFISAKYTYYKSE